MPSQPSNAGIVTDQASGQRHIPESVRADGSTRKAIKVRPGYQPPEDVKLYKSRAAEVRERGRRVGIPGTAGVQDAAPATANKTADQDQAGSAAANKNAKRREARKKAKAEGGSADKEGQPEQNKEEEDKKEEEPVADPQAEAEKKARNLRKKLKQARELQNKKEGGEALLPEQIAKVIKINELIRGLEALGFDAEGEPADKGKD